MEHSFEKVNVENLLYAANIAVERINKDNISSITVPAFLIINKNGVICEVQVTVVTEKEDFLNEIHF